MIYGFRCFHHRNRFMVQVDMVHAEVLTLWGRVRPDMVLHLPISFGRRQLCISQTLSSVSCSLQ